MRTFQLKKILELIKTLNEANYEINGFLLCEDYSKAIQVMADCQAFVLSICEYINNIEGEGTSTVKLLEKYYKVLDDVSLKINNKNDVNNLRKLLQKHLLRIESSAQSELKSEKIEIAFFPYKASMFDSLESIWSAAKNDPSCNAYVVPIPYYERLSGGSLGQMRYDGEQYPDNIPIMDWKEYNPAIRYPDIIFIHSPYDDGNYATSVHPDFYSKRLKDFTGLLVYVPYFVCVDDVDESFCVCSGTLHSDIVIVQSEKIRRTYIQVIKKYEKDNKCIGVFGKIEEKIIALGSPKFDKVMNIKPEDFTVPDKWKRLINRTDGTQKRVVLYNTSINRILHENELYLKKMQYVINTFRDCDNVVLLWRPHPLSETIYQAVRPHLLNEYERIISEYKMEGWGIYDDTPDLHRAIAISDAYYGDGSSIAALYQCAGKLAMIQSIDIYIKNKNLYELAFENLYDDGEYFWFTSFNSNALYKMDKLTWEAEYMGSFPDELPNRWRLYSSISRHGDDLYFAPLLAGKIMKFNCSSKRFEEISFIFRNTNGDDWDSGHTKFCSSVRYNHWVFFFSASFPAFLRYDTISGRIDLFSDWLRETEELRMNAENTFFKYANCCCVQGSSVFICVRDTNAIIVFDMETCTSKVHEVGSRRNKYSGICFDGCDFWLSPVRDTPIVKWNFKDNTVKEYDLPSGYLSDVAFYLSLWSINYSNGYVWIFPNKANMALKINIKSDCVEIAEDFQSECEFGEEGAFTPQIYIFSKAVDNVIYAHTGRSNRFIMYDCLNGHKVEKTIVPAPESLEILENMHLRQAFFKEPSMLKTISDTLYYESNLLTLKYFIDYICLENVGESAEVLKNRQREYIVKSNANMDGSAGRLIYHFCKESVIAENKGYSL